MALTLHTFKKKHVYIPLMLLGCFIGYNVLTNDATPEQSQANLAIKRVTTFDAATLASSTQIIEATGTVETLEAVELSSEVSARVTRVNVALGDSVRRGQTLVVFNNADLVASRAGAEADLESAHANRETIEAQYRTQEAALARVKITGENNIATAELALRTAENNLRQTEEVQDTRVVRDAYVAMVPVLLSAQDSLQSVLTTVDNILGIDNTFANESFKSVLSIQHLTKKQEAQQHYVRAKALKQTVDTRMQTIIGASPSQDIDTMIVLMEEALQEYRTLGMLMSEVLDATPPVGPLSQSQLDGLKASIQSARSTIAGQSTAVSNQSNAIATAKTSFDSLQIAYERAVGDLEAAKRQAAADIASGEAQLAQIAASLKLQDAQIKSAAARVAGIGASLAKTAIRAPISGTIAGLPAKVGELMNPGQLAVRIVNTGSYQVKTFVPAEAVSRIHKGNRAMIAGTYEGVVTNVSPSIDPSTNKVEVIVLVTSDNPVLVSDQFVTVTLEQTVDTLSEFTRIPLESVRLTSEGAMVLVVTSNNTLEARRITIGQVVGSTIEADIRDIDLPIVSSVRGLEVGETVQIEA